MSTPSRPAQPSPAVIRALYRQARTAGTLTFHATPDTAGECVEVCAAISADLGSPLDTDRRARLAGFVAGHVERMAVGSQRCVLRIAFNRKVGTPPVFRVEGVQPLRAAAQHGSPKQAQVGATLMLPAVPSLADDYVRLCDTLAADLGAPLTAEQRARLKHAIAVELVRAAKTGQRHMLHFVIDRRFGMAVNYRVNAVKWAHEDPYHAWTEAREAPLFGIEPDARVSVLASAAGDPRECRVLDIGALTGRNTLALARRGHPVTAVEMTPEFVDVLAFGVERESLDVEIIGPDDALVMAEMSGAYRLVVLSGVVADLWSPEQLGRMFELAGWCLAPGGQLVFNAFLPRGDYLPDPAARGLGQQCQTVVVTRDELAEAADGFGLELVADDPVGDYERTHLPDGAWPPTPWYPDWVAGRDVFAVDPGADSPIEMRWLVYRRG